MLRKRSCSRGDGHSASADNPKRADLERYCVDRFEQMKKESDIKECMSK